MKERFVSVLIGALLGTIVGMLYFISEIKNYESVINGGVISFSSAVNKTIPSVIYIYSDNCREGVYGCPLGTGVIMDNDGHAVTNYHVTQNAKNVIVMLSGNEVRNAVVIGHDKLTDISVLKLNGEKLKPINVNPDRKNQVGDFVFVIGNPYNLVASVSHGVISAIGRGGIGNIGRQTFIQTDAPINKGNSGGPLINMFGEMIGLNSLAFNNEKNSGSVGGISFALPVQLVVQIMGKLILDGEIIRGCIGVDARNTLFSEAVGKIKYKVVVASTIRGSQAELAGILPGDIIISIDNKNIDSSQKALDILEGIRPGGTVEIVVKRADNTRHLKVGVTNCNDK